MMFSVAMDSIPIVPYSQIALRDDVIASATLLRGEMAELRSELRGEMAELRTEMGELRIDVRSEIVDVRSDITGLESRMVTSMHQMSVEIRRLFLLQMALMVALVGLVLRLTGG